MGSDLRSARDLEGRSSATERPRLRHRPPYAGRSPGRREPYHQSQAVPAAALPLSKKWSSYIQNRSSLEPLRALQRHRPPTAQQLPPSNSEARREVKSGHGRAPHNVVEVSMALINQAGRARKRPRASWARAASAVGVLAVAVAVAACSSGSSSGTTGATAAGFKPAPQTSGPLTVWVDSTRVPAAQAYREGPPGCEAQHRHL